MSVLTTAWVCARVLPEQMKAFLEYVHDFPGGFSKQPEPIKVIPVYLEIVKKAPAARLASPVSLQVEATKADMLIEPAPVEHPPPKTVVEPPPKKPKRVTAKPRPGQSAKLRAEILELVKNAKAPPVALVDIKEHLCAIHGANGYSNVYTVARAMVRDGLLVRTKIGQMFYVTLPEQFTDVPVLAKARVKRDPHTPVGATRRKP